MAEKNSFKLLAEEQERLNVPPPEIEEYIFSNIRIMSIMGKSMEVFLPGAIDMFIQLLGGSANSLERPEVPNLKKGTFKKDEDEATPSDAGTKQ
ncbi:MAG: hypothetical protein ACI9XO_001072 [Paraglaciecola sp.]|jgi:hypothetical protein